MSLDWNTTKCKVPTAHGKQEAEERELIVFATNWIGLSSVTRDNLREWLVRLRVCEELGRGQIVGRNPLGSLERWIGLETNVDDETREEWTNRLLTVAFERAECKADRVFGVPA
jgi:hypothetical protein